MVPIADRTTKVSLVAQVSGYVAGMEQAAKKTREVGSEAAKLGQKKQALQDVGRASLAMGAVAAAGVALAIAKYAEFDQAMSQVKAATQETAGNMGLLRDAALEAGARTVFSATEAANAIEELGKNGLTTSEILSGGLDSALDLAAAGGLGVARAAEVAALSMKQFNLAGKDAPHIADLLAAGAGKAAGDVEDMAQALAQGGLVAHSTGLSIEETTGVLAAFADKALIGSDAGTSLKTMLQRLTPQSAQAKEEMERLGISAYDAQGNFIGAAKFAGNLHDALRPLTAEQRNASEAIIFGSDAVRAANVLYEEGADGIQKYIDQTNDSGYAAQVAADRLDNLAGDVEQLGGSLDTALIKTGSGANDILRDIVQSATFLVNAFGEMPQPALDAALAVGTVAAGIALVGGAALVAVPKVAQMKAAMTEMGVTAKGAALGIGLIGGAVAGATLLIGALVQQAAEQAGLVDELADSYDKATGAITDYTREVVAKRLAESGAFEVAKEAGYTQKELTDAVLAGGDALDTLKSKVGGLNDLAGVFDGSSLAAGNAYYAIRDLGEGITDSRQKFKDMAAANEEATTASEENTEALNTLQGAAASAGDEVSDLADQIRGFGSAQLDVNSATREFEASVDDLTQSVIDNGTSLEVSEDAGRKNQAALDALAKSSLELASATYTQTGSQDAAKDAIQRGRDALIEQLGQFGITGEEAEKYADKLGLIPDNVSTLVTVNTTPAQRALDQWLADNASHRIHVAVGAGGSGGITRATGGILPGPPSSKDNMFIHAASGEFVVNAAATQRNRALLESINSGTVRGYASGGYVAPVRYAASEGAGTQAGPRVVIQKLEVNNPRQLTAQGSTVAGLRRVDMELGL